MERGALCLVLWQSTPFSMSCVVATWCGRCYFIVSVGAEAGAPLLAISSVTSQ
jgi:hypothetical protein